MQYDLRSALADALPAAGPTRAAVKAMDDIGFKSDPQNNDMKELFVRLDLRNKDDEEETNARQTAPAGMTASQALLDYRKEKKGAVEKDAHESAKRANLTVPAREAGAVSVGLARATGVGEREVEAAAEDERYLRKVHQSKTAARMSSKQKRRRKLGKDHGTGYEERYEGKVLNKARRKGRMAAMKQMY